MRDIILASVKLTHSFPFHYVGLKFVNRFHFQLIFGIENSEVNLRVSTNPIQRSLTFFYRGLEHSIKLSGAAFFTTQVFVQRLSGFSGSRASG